MYIFLSGLVAFSLPTYETLKDRTFGSLIGQLYTLAIALVGLAVLINFIWAGVLYMTAAGNSGAVSKANQKMTNSVIGAILLISAYMILNFINPELNKDQFAIPSFSPMPAVATPNPDTPVANFVTQTQDPSVAKANLSNFQWDISSVPVSNLNGITQYAVDALNSIKSQCNASYTCVDTKITGVQANGTGSNTFTVPSNMSGNSIYGLDKYIMDAYVKNKTGSTNPVGQNVTDLQNQVINGAVVYDPIQPGVQYHYSSGNWTIQIINQGVK